MNKLIKEIEFGEKVFKVAINREIALKVAEEYPDFIAEVMERSTDYKDISTMVRDGKLREALDTTDYLAKGCIPIVEYALPYMLAEAKSNENAKDILDYAKENDAIQTFSLGIWEIILMGFTNSGVVEAPKVKFTIK